LSSPYLAQAKNITDGTHEALACIERIGNRMAQLDPLKDFPVDPGKANNVKSSEITIKGVAQIVLPRGKTLAHIPCSASMHYLTHPDIDLEQIVHHLIESKISAGKETDDEGDELILSDIWYPSNRIPLDPLEYLSGRGWATPLEVKSCEVTKDKIEAHFIHAKDTSHPIHQKLQVLFVDGRMVSYRTILEREHQSWFSRKFETRLNYRCSSM